MLPSGYKFTFCKISHTTCSQSGSDVVFPGSSPTSTLLVLSTGHTKFCLFCKLTRPRDSFIHVSHCTLLLIFQNQSPLPRSFQGEWILACASHSTMFLPLLHSETSNNVEVRTLTLSNPCGQKSMYNFGLVVYYKYQFLPEIKVPKGQGSFIFIVLPILITVFCT